MPKKDKFLEPSNQNNTLDLSKPKLPLTRGPQEPATGVKARGVGGKFDKTGKTPLFIRLARYSLERFQFWLLIPLIVLSNLILAKIFDATMWQVVIISFFNLWQYFTLRVFDEYKDFEIDKKLHPQRPVIRGLVSLKELAQTSGIWLILCLLGFWLVTPNLLWLTLAIATFLIIMFVSGKDYFLPKLRNNFYLYNALNTTNTLTILGSTYLAWLAIIDRQLDFSEILPHLTLVVGGSLLLELTRKVEEKGEDGYLFHLKKWQFGIGLALTQVLILGSFWLNYQEVFWWMLVITGVNSAILFPVLLNKEKFNSLKLLSLCTYLVSLLLFWL